MSNDAAERAIRSIALGGMNYFLLVPTPAARAQANLRRGRVHGGGSPPLDVNLMNFDRRSSQAYRGAAAGSV
ncbi:MAG: hypothetical protein ACRECU_13855 [Methylocella sp.]